MISKEQFIQYAKQGYNRIPLTMVLNADLDTPLSLYLKLVGTQRKNSFLLESVVGGERFGRYSYIGLPARTYIKSEGLGLNTRTVLYENNQIITSINASENIDALSAIQKLQQQYKPVILENMPRFCGGWAGYFAYENVYHIETCLQQPKYPEWDKLTLPNTHLLLCDELVVLDNLKSQLHLIIYIDPYCNNNNNKDNINLITHNYMQGLQRLATLQTQLEQGIAYAALPDLNKKTEQANYSNLKSNFKDSLDQNAYEEAVNIAKKYIFSGDIMQVVLSKRKEMHYDTDGIVLYRALRQLNPSPYMYYYHFEDTQLVGSSPELLVRREIRTDHQLNHTHHVLLRPIAGTRMRGKTEQEDALLAKNLLEDEKECAEHTMLIDLARNDIGRIAQTGSVKITQHMCVEKYSHVQHIVSSVEGQIDAHIENMIILKAVFPAGTLSGAAKVRAMQIIAELEPMPRHIYGGGVGYMSFNGEMDLAIAIRTAVLQNNIAYVQAGAGIVADSQAYNEWLETENKAKALVQAIYMVQDNLTQ
jgi:anthranilate synthase component I